MLDILLAAGVGGSIVAGVFTLLQVLFNKKLRTPADRQAELNAAIIERNQIIKDLREDVASLKKDLEAMSVRMDAVEDENDTLKRNALSRDAYIYRCLAVIRANGLLIPDPIPEGIFP
jgi:chromosome segregation ATPase